MGEKKQTTKPQGGDAEKREFNPADEAQKRRRATEIDETDDRIPDEHEEAGPRKLLGKRHSS